MFFVIIFILFDLLWPLPYLFDPMLMLVLVSLISWRMTDSSSPASFSTTKAWQLLSRRRAKYPINTSTKMWNRRREDLIRVISFRVAALNEAWFIFLLENNFIVFVLKSLNDHQLIFRLCFLLEGVYVTPLYVFNQ